MLSATSRSWCIRIAAGLFCLTCMAPAIGDAAQVRLTVDGQAVVTVPPARVVEGRVVAPVAPVAAALGAEIRWDSRDGALHLDRPFPWIDLGHESPILGYGPYDLTPLGPILAVRRFLSDLQWQSLESTDPGAPVLARYEIVDAYGEAPFQAVGADLASFKYEFTVSAILYWAYLDQTTLLPRGAARVWQSRDPSGRSSAHEDTPRLARTRVEVVEYTVLPNDTTVLGRADLAPLAETKGIAAVVAGKTGWKVVDENRGKDIYGRPLPSAVAEPGMIPLYDLSVQRVDRQTAVLRDSLWLRGGQSSWHP